MTRDVTEAKTAPESQVKENPDAIVEDAVVIEVAEGETAPESLVYE